MPPTCSTSTPFTTSALRVDASLLVNDVVIYCRSVTYHLEISRQSFTNGITTHSHVTPEPRPAAPSSAQPLPIVTQSNHVGSNVCKRNPGRLPAGPHIPRLHRTAKCLLHVQSVRTPDGVFPIKGFRLRRIEQRPIHRHRKRQRRKHVQEPRSSRIEISHRLISTAEETTQGPPLRR